MAKEAVSNAVKDAKISYQDFEQAFVGYVYGREENRWLHWIFINLRKHIPFRQTMFFVDQIKVTVLADNVLCILWAWPECLSSMSTIIVQLVGPNKYLDIVSMKKKSIWLWPGSSALYLAAKQIAGGLSDCVLALGFEKMQRGSLSSQVILIIILMINFIRSFIFR